MKKMFLILLLLIYSPNAYTEIYHGIDIDEIYEDSDWNSKEDIIKLIDNYILTLEYQKELDNCPDTLPENLNCYDKIAQKVITNLYVYSKTNLNQYKRLKEVLSEAYGLKNCQNKNIWPNGNLCEIETEANVATFLKGYIQELITKNKEVLSTYSSILDKYK